MSEKLLEISGLSVCYEGERMVPSPAGRSHFAERS